MPISKAFLQNVSHKPGVYLMKDRHGLVLYIGKARDLRKRIASYARHDIDHYTKTAKMLEHVNTVETILTRTEKEALILEASLIKKHKPRYNVILRDDKNYPYIKVTVQEKWPRLVMVRRRSKDSARYFGPYSSSSAMWATINHINSLFPLRRCKEKVLKTKERPCLNYQIGRCLAPCSGKVSHAHYQEMVNNVLLVLEGKKKELIRNLEKQMHTASAALLFEEAAALRDKITAINKTLEKQVIVAEHLLDQDVFGFARFNSAVAISIMLVRKGVISGFIPYVLEEPVGSKEEIIEEVLQQYYGGDKPVPKEVIIPYQIAGREVIAEWLHELRAAKVSIITPKRGPRLQLLKMATENARKVFVERDLKDRAWQKLARNLSKNLRVDNDPNRIECFDISNLSGKQAVGAMVSYVDGEKKTSLYRHYKIRTVQGPDDYAMMAEVLYRRFSNYDDQDLPDLLIIDGGKGHLQVAVNILKELDLISQIDVISIAKEKKDEGEKIFKPGRKNPLPLKRNDPVLLFIMRIRDEAHRYGITFHRKLQRKSTLDSNIDAIPGVGPARKKALLNTLGSLKRLKEATLEEIAAVHGISSNLAENIYKQLHPERFSKTEK